MNLIHPYPYREESIKDYYSKELELEKTKPYIYMYYEHEGKQYMKQVPIHDAQVIVNDL